MGRISRQVMFMEMARVASRRSTCHRLNVGALLTMNNSPVSVGWNGHEPGAPHCAGNDCPGRVPGNCGTAHAEANAIRKAEELVDNGDPIDLYLTHSPCRDCCRIIQESRLSIRRVFFEVPYRNTDHLQTFFRWPHRGPSGALRRTDIYEVTPAGYIVDYFSRQVVELP
jgi:dCMP deaminase